MPDMMAELGTVRRRPVETLRSIVTQVRADDVPFMAGSVAYQAFASLVPLLILLFVAVAAVGDQALAEEVVRQTEGVLPAAAQSLVRDAIVGDDASGPSASVVGVVVLLWGSLKIFRGLDKAFTEIYETDAESSFVDQVRDGLIVLVALGVSIPATVGATSLFAAADGLLYRWLNLLALLVGLTAAFLPMYRFFPDADVGWAEAVPGAVFAAVGWTVLQFVFQLYLTVSSAGDASSVFGAILLLLTWLYLSGLVLLLGAVVNAVLLGEGDPEPKTDEDDSQVDSLETRLADERERRRRIEWERDRLKERLEQEDGRSTSGAAAWSATGGHPGGGSPVTDAELAQLRTRTRRLRRRLRWLERPLLVRGLLRLLGVTPPPPDLGPSTNAPAAQRGATRRAGGDAD